MLLFFPHTGKIIIILVKRQILPNGISVYVCYGVEDPASRKINLSMNHCKEAKKSWFLSVYFALLHAVFIFLVIQNLGGQCTFLCGNIWEVNGFFHYLQNLLSLTLNFIM